MTPTSSPATGSAGGSAGLVLTMDGLQALIDLLRDSGHAVIAPTVRDAVVTYAEIAGVSDLPVGVGDEQEAAHYRLRERTDTAVFGYTVPASSWKGLLFPARELIRDDPVDPVDERPCALFGVRSCDLHALRIHDQVLLGRGFVDVRYAARRAGTFVVAVACTEPGGTCFCASMGTGPQPDRGFDLCLTELLEGGHRFLAVAGSPEGGQVLARLEGTAASPGDRDLAARTVAAAVGRMGRTMDTEGLKAVLYDAAEHPHWQDVAERCLACANCTMVCPTCFCTTVEDAADLLGSAAGRSRVWDSCFTTEFSHLHGGSVRDTTSARYRQWVTHKLAAWVDQFGTSGCVGCGRCVTWCPVGIDLTAEVGALRTTSRPPTGSQV